MLDFDINLLESLKIPLMVHLDDIEEGQVFVYKGKNNPHCFIKRQRAKPTMHRDLVEAVCLSLSTQRFFIVAPAEMKEVQVIGECSVLFKLTQVK